MTARLDLKDLKADPFLQLADWLGFAMRAKTQPNPNAACLCTVGAGNEAQGRMILIKSWEKPSLGFYTNSHSEKGLALAAHPQAELVLHWDALGRQIRMRGRVETLAPSISDTYFASRPRASQIGAWASAQSQEVASREAMDSLYREFEQKYAGKNVPRPAHWHGYELIPNRFEFWQADMARFHDRFEYVSKSDNSWKVSRLFP